MDLATAFATVIPAERRVGFKAYDGSSTGLIGAEVILEVTRPRGIHYIAGAPNQLGLARAYVAGDLEIHGDVYEALKRLYPMPLDHVSLTDRAKLARRFARDALVRPVPPAQERALGGRRHSRSRDAEAIHHHYDVSNRFYRLHLRRLPDAGRIT